MSRAELLKDINNHEKGRLMKNVTKLGRLSAGNCHADGKESAKSSSAKPPFRFGAPTKQTRPAKNTSNEVIQPRWNASNSKPNRRSDITVPSLNDNNVKLFQKKSKNHSPPRRSQSSGFSQNQNHNKSAMPFVKSSVDIKKRNFSPERQSSDESSVVIEKSQKPSDVKARDRAKGLSFSQVGYRNQSPLSSAGPRVLAAAAVRKDETYEVHKQEKSFIVIRPKIATEQRNPPTAVVAPLRETSKPALPPKASVLEAKKKPLKPVMNINDIPDEKFDTFIEHNIPEQNFDTFIENDIPQMLQVKMPVDYSVGPPPLPEKKVVKRKKSRKVKNEKQLGHDFKEAELENWIMWCDACNGIIVSVFGAHHVRCIKCNMLCHNKCVTNVSLTCEADLNDPFKSMSSEEGGQFNSYKTTFQETKDESTLKEYNTIKGSLLKKFSKEEILKKIDEFNKTVKGSQQMTLQGDSQSFRGFIRVSMNLQRPVSAAEGTKNVKQTSQLYSGNKESFYIEKGAMKALHLTSDTTAEKVVEALLNKFKIIDNPMKFALFERFKKEEGHVILRKMIPKERPLFLRLLWGNNTDRSFILQENESRDINWNAFSVTELQNFKILMDKEEETKKQEVRLNYAMCKQHMMLEIKKREAGGDRN